MEKMMDELEGHLEGAIMDVAGAASEIMRRVSDRFSLHVIEGTSSLGLVREGETLEVSMTLRFSIPIGIKRGNL